MLNTRVIPCLLLKGKGFVKTERFQKPRYLGDPLNIVKIFNDKEAPEIIILDITATKEIRPPNFNLLEKIASECFMPLAYGGGIRTINDMEKIFSIGYEKIILNSITGDCPNIIQTAAETFGNQSIVISIDVKRHLLGEYEVFTRCGEHSLHRHPVEHAQIMEKMGAGEIMINSIDRDGTMEGYDLELIKSIADTVSIPVLASGGAGKLQDFSDAINIGNASAVVAGSLFVFHGKQRGVLISFPAEKELSKYIS